MNDSSKMDDGHVALLRRHRDTFLNSVEVDRLIPMLENENILTSAEVRDMKQLSSSQARVQRLLDVLQGKGRTAFKCLCLALETTYPHLLTVMCLGRDRDVRSNPTGSSPSTVSSYTSESSLDEHIPRILMPGSSPTAFSNIGKGTSLQSSLDSDIEEPIRPPPSMFPAVSLPERGLPQREYDYEKLKEKCHMAMVKLEKLTHDNYEVHKKCELAKKEAEHFRRQHRGAMNNAEQQRSELQALRQEYGDLMGERSAMQQENNDLRQQLDDSSKELNNMRVQSMMGYPDVKQMYDMAMDRNNTLKHEYDNLQQRYSELKGSSMNKEDRLQEELDRVKQQNESLRMEVDTVSKERNALKQQCTSAIREFDKLRREQDDFRQQDFRAQSEIRTLKQKLKKAESDRDSAEREHRLVMSERDEVHREIEKLQDEVHLEATKRKNAEEKLKSKQAEFVQMRQKLVDTMQNHDMALRRNSELSEHYRGLISDRISAQNEELEVVRHERKEALTQLEEVIQERYKAKQEQEQTNNEYKQINMELEDLRRKVDSLTRELKEAVQVAEQAKKQRDFAFSERDKIVAERESIRTLCDKMRRERDRAVSNYAEALRKTDDIEKKKNEVTKELNQVKQNVIQQEEKEARMRQQLIAHHSHDSAIDADSHEWQMEMVALETGMDDGDTTVLGFDIGDCNKDVQFPDDCSVVVTKVDKGSIADGRLRVNDCVVRVNNIDLTNGGSLSIAVQALKNTRGVLNMVVKRRRPSGVRNHLVKLFFGGREHGLVLENGIFINRIVPGSAAAKEGSLLPGDRILYVDGFLVENKTVPEVEKMLCAHSESVVLSIVRATTTSMSSSASPTGVSLQSAETASSSKSSLAVNAFPLLVDIPEQQRPDRNGNPQQQSAKAASSDMVQKLLRDFVDAQQQKQEGMRRESVHSKQSSHESCSASGERTPRALSRENSLREPLHMSMDQRVPFSYDNSLKRGDVSQRNSRRSHSALTCESDKSKAHSHLNYHQQASPNSHHAGYHSHDSSRDMNGHAFEKSGRELMSNHGNIPNTQEMHHMERVHSRESSKDGLTNGEVRPGADGATDNFVDELRDLSPKQFTRDGPNRKSSHAWGNGRDMNRKRPGTDQWNERKRNSFRSPPPSHGNSNVSSWDECKNVRNASVKAPSHNGNVQQQRHENGAQIRVSSPHVAHASFDNSVQHQAQNSHARSRSTSGWYDQESTGQSQEHSRLANNDWTSRKEWNDSFPNGFVENKTIPVKSQRQSSQIKDHSTWPKSRGAPDCLVPDGRKKQKREWEPIMNFNYMNGHSSHSSRDESEQIKPTPPSRTSSLRRHMESSFADTRRQSSISVSEVKGQGSLSSPQSPTVTVTPISPKVQNFSSNMSTDASKPSGQNLPHGNGFYPISSQPGSAKYVQVPIARSEQAAVFSQVSPQVSPPPSQWGDTGTSISERAIVPRVEPSVPLVSIGSKKPVHTHQVLRAELVNTVPPFDAEHSVTGNGGGVWEEFSIPPGPTQAQVVRTPHHIPTYEVKSYPIPPMVVRHRQNMANYLPSSPDPFPSSRSISQSSLPDTSYIPYNNKHMSTGFSTNSLPHNRNRKICWPPPTHSSSSDIVSTQSGHSSPNSPLSDSPLFPLSPSSSVEPTINIISEGGPDDPRLIEIDNILQQGLGFTIKEGYEGGIFINSVTEGSLAEKVGLRHGDQILEYNGINFRKAQHKNAVLILTRPTNTIHIKAQYNISKIGGPQRDSLCSSSQSTPIASQTSTRANSPTPTITPPTPRASRTHSILSSNSSIMTGEVSQPRFVFLKKYGSSLGVRIYGGNRVGIFVSEIEPMSVASKADGLRVGDQILEYNGVNLRNATAEQAATELQKPAEDISILAQHNIAKFNKVQNHHGDEMFIKALVDFSADREGQLSFKKEDILLVDNTMYNGSLGVWNAWHVDLEGQKNRCGQIPSKAVLHREIVVQRLRSEGSQEDVLRTGSQRRASGPARRSFLKKKKKKHQHNNSKDSEGGSITDVPIHDDVSVPTYLRVERLDMRIKRPVILLGPLVEVVAVKMEEESRNKYTRSQPNKVHSTQQLLMKDIENGLIIDFQRRDGMFEVIHTSMVKDICKGGCHCLLYNLCPSVAERLQSLHLHPIVIFIKYKSIKNIKEQKDPHFLPDKVNHRQAKELFEAAGRLEQDYRSLFSDIVQAGNQNLASIVNRVKKIIDLEQRKPIWIPSNLTL